MSEEEEEVHVWIYKKTLKKSSLLEHKWYQKSSASCEARLYECANCGKLLVTEAKPK